jgi:hypothetical protein
LIMFIVYIIFTTYEIGVNMDIQNPHPEFDSSKIITRI